MNFEPRAGEIDLPWVGFCLTTPRLDGNDATNRSGSERGSDDYQVFGRGEKRKANLGAGS
jgi:hypothetical protein